MSQNVYSRRAGNGKMATLLTVGAASLLTATWHSALAASERAIHRDPPHRIKPTAKPVLDYSGRRRIGIASYYANWFAGRKMANGYRMDPHGNNAASRTLPLGTVARVTNLRTHQSALVTIQDRGPYIQGRIVDLSPATARRIGITRRMGIARVRVTPVAIPLGHGHLELVNHSTLHRERVALAERRTAEEVE